MAAGTGSYTVTISAVDRASAVISGVDKSLARLADQAKNISSGFGGFSVEALSSVSESFDNIAKSAGGAAGQVAKFVGAGALLTAGGAVYELRRWIAGFADLGTHLSITSQAIGISGQRLAELENAQRLAGGAAGDMDASLRGLRQTMQDSIYGNNPTANNIFRSLNIDVGEFQRGAQNTLPTMMRLADYTKQLADINPQNAIDFLNAIGIGGQNLYLYRDGAAGVQAYINQARQLGTMDDTQIANARVAHIEMVGIGVAFENLGNQIGAVFGPTVTMALQTIEHFIAQNLPDIKTGLQEFQVWLKGVVTTENVKYFEETIQNVVTWVKNLIVALHDLNHMGVVEIFARAFHLPDWLVRILSVLDTQIPAPGSSGPHDAIPFTTPNSQGALGSAGIIPTIGGLIGWLNPFSPAHAMPSGVPGALTLLGAPPITTTIPPEGRALLDAIHRGEAPDWNLGNTRENPSHFGPWQFDIPTWNDISRVTGITGLGLDDQARNAWALAQQRYRANGGWGDLAAFLRQGGDPSPYLRGTWVSLPGGSQPNNNTPGFNQALADDLRRYSQAITGAPSVTVTPPSNVPVVLPMPAPASPPGDDADSVLARLRHEHLITVRIDDRNPHAGRVITVDPTTGTVVNPPRTEMPMQR